jgi:hypothetical protein
MSENREFKNLIMEQQKHILRQYNEITKIIPKIGNTTINQKFNINVFLNEQCRNALNIEDFIDSIKISVEELDKIKMNGLADGLGSAIITNMQKLKLEERPIHCTDLKREILYIKNNNEWNKDETRNCIKSAIKSIASKPYNALRQWIDENPDYINDEKKQQYITQSLQIVGSNDNKIDDKIVRSICNYTHIKIR